VKPIKMFGLAVLAAMMATAFIGASSAMAGNTALCTTDPSGGACATKFHHVHETTLTGAQATLATSVLTVHCTVLFLGDVTSANDLGAPLVISGAFTYSACDNNCTATEENSPAEILVLRTGHETASVTGEGLVHLVCGFFINCRYNGTGLEGTGKGPLLSTETNGEVSLTEQEANRESGFCPEISELTIRTTPLSATYIGT
jgi:hypothetical protein